MGSRGMGLIQATANGRSTGKGNLYENTSAMFNQFHLRFCTTIALDSIFSPQLNSMVLPVLQFQAFLGQRHDQGTVIVEAAAGRGQNPRSVR
jgi:hypothetical protein